MREPRCVERAAELAPRFSTKNIPKFIFLLPWQPAELDDALPMVQEYLYLNTRDELLRIDYTKIVFIEGDGNYTHIVQKNKQKASVCINLMKMEQLLSERLCEKATIFVRIGKRYIVNRNFIYQINVLLQKMVLTDGESFTYQLSISKEALRQMKDLMVHAAIAKNNNHNNL